VRVRLGVAGLAVAVFGISGSAAVPAVRRPVVLDGGLRQPDEGPRHYQRARNAPT
jgi:hypothetical protein